jgi:hypothetical protein
VSSTSSSKTSPSQPAFHSHEKLLPWSFAPLRDIGKTHPLSKELPKLFYDPPSEFLTLSTVYAAFCFASLFHPAATCGIPSSEIFPASKLFELSLAFPFMSFPTIACKGTSPNAPAQAPRLQGFIPTGDP